MPLTTTGQSVLESMEETYPSKKVARSVFEASYRKGKPGSEKWKRKPHRRRGTAQERALRRRLRAEA